MSFFSEIFKQVDVIENDFYINIILHKYIGISGIFKVIDFNSDCVIIDIKNKKFKIIGSGLNVKSLAKNEMVVQGDILGFVEE